jgi:hypothetical protein
VTDFDLGGRFEVHQLAYWGTNAIFGMQDFRVLIDDDAMFSSATDLGTFSATLPSSSLSAPGQVFDLTDGIGRYVRFEHLSVFSDRSAMAEVAFDVTPASVPEPSSVYLLGVGMAGLVWRRRKKYRA